MHFIIADGFGIGIHRKRGWFFYYAFSALFVIRLLVFHIHSSSVFLFLVFFLPNSSITKFTRNNSLCNVLNKNLQFLIRIVCQKKHFRIAFVHTNQINIKAKEAAAMAAMASIALQIAAFETECKNKYAMHRYASSRIVFFHSLYIVLHILAKAIGKATIDLNQSSIWANTRSYSKDAKEKKLNLFKVYSKVCRILFIYLFRSRVHCVCACSFCYTHYKCANLDAIQNAK